MIVAPAAGYLITLTSAVQNLQAVVLTNGGGFYPQVISDVFDRLTILVQQVAEKTSRALTVAISSEASTALPPPVANNLLGWDALGASIINYTGMASAAVSAAMAPIVSAATTAAARVGLGAAASGANTDITSLASPELGSATATTQAPGDNSTKVATTAFVTVVQNAADARYAGAMPNFTASTASALISASLGTGKVDFRNAVLSNGTPVEYNLTSTLTLAMNSTAASLGATSGVAATLIYAIVYNAGNPQLAVCNLSGGLQLDETNLITTTAIGSVSTAANVWYSATAITTASQYRIVGRVDATWTSGTGWSSPTLVQPISATTPVLLPSKFPSSLGSTGWKKYPDASSPTGYFIEQWGSTTSSSSGGGAVLATFPIAFPNAVFAPVATVNFASTSTASAWGDSAGLSAMNVHSNAVSVPIFWNVKGY
jgi:hypothetical protein